MALKLLIAEDEESIRRGMDKYIRTHTDRFERVFLAKDGQEAIDMIFKHKPHIMLLDIQMPVHNGIEVMKEAKRSELLPLTVILSGYDEFKFAQQALKLGAREYLLKPCRSSEILDCLDRFANEIEGRMESLELKDDAGPHYAVMRAKEYMEENYTEDLTLQNVAEFVGVSQGYLSTLFSQELEYGFKDYLNQLRIERACMYLQQNHYRTYEIAYKVGFNDEKHFSKVFKKIKGVSPSEYRKGLLEEA